MAVWRGNLGEPKKQEEEKGDIALVESPHLGGIRDLKANDAHL